MPRHPMTETAAPSKTPVAWIWLAVALATALHLPSLGAGFYADDYTHQLALDGSISIPTLQPWSLYDFGEASDWPQDPRSSWAIHWWTSPDFKGRFFRPLTSLTLWLDHALYGAEPLGYHVTSLAWYLAALLLTVAVYRGLGLDRATTALAIVLVAGTNGATLPVGWVANRNTLVASVFVLAAVLVAVRGRGPWRLPAALACGLAAVGGKESGVLAFALVAAWSLLEACRAGSPTQRRRHAVAAAASAVAALAVIAALAAAGYGTRSLFYATPWTDPARYLGHLAVLLTAGGLRLLAPASLDLMMLHGVGLPAAMAAGVAAVAALGWALGRRMADHPAAPFLAAWAVLALLPQGGVMPSDRLLFDAAVGSAGLLAIGVRRTLGADAGAPRRARIAARTVLVCGGVLGPAFVGVQSAAVPAAAGDLREAILATDPGPRAGGPVDAVVLQSGTTMLAFSLAPTWAVESGRDDVRFPMVQLAGVPLEWSRDGDRSCVLRSAGGPLLATPFERVFRSSAGPPTVTTMLGSAVMGVEPLEAAGGGLRAVRLVFPRSLDDPRLRFLVPIDGILRPIDPPPIGETVLLPRPAPAVPLLP